MAAHLNSEPSGAVRRAEREWDYRTRMMASLAASLLGVTLLLHVPLGGETLRIGWNSAPVSDLVEFNTDRTIRASRGEGSVTSSTGVPTPEPTPAGLEEGESEQPLDEAEQSTVRPMRARETVFEFVESPPAIRGGLGAYYINIEYPPEAIERQIEGRLVLRFVVDTDGRARDILVLESLHPLCDSAAVRALRTTTFVPGRQEGKKVPVRMQLPVRFRLVGPGQSSTS